MLCVVCVFVVGCGGFGCLCVIYFVVLGVGMFGLCDVDVVELSNLY